MLPPAAVFIDNQKKQSLLFIGHIGVTIQDYKTKRCYHTTLESVKNNKGILIKCESKWDHL